MSRDVSDVLSCHKLWMALPTACVNPGLQDAVGELRQGHGGIAGRPEWTPTYG